MGDSRNIRGVFVAYTYVSGMCRECIGYVSGTCRRGRGARRFQRTSTDLHGNADT